jgi:hypothetical protein
MDADDRLAEREPERIGDGGTDEQRSREPRPLRVAMPSEGRAT